jgi:hypothetical protein
MSAGPQQEESRVSIEEDVGKGRSHRVAGAAQSAQPQSGEERGSLSALAARAPPPARQEPAMTLYVHAPGVRNIYHWCRNCSKYPSRVGGSTSTRPEGKLCDECKAKERNGTCRT